MITRLKMFSPALPNLLANMWGWYGTQLMPPLMSAYCKYKLEWVNAIHITSSGTYTLRPSCTSNTVYRIDHNMPPGEYFLAEYRYPCGFDAELRAGSSDPGDDRHGAALWHVDESGILGTQRNAWGYDEDVINYQTNAWPGDGTWPGSHYKVALVQADGKWDLERSLNRGDNTDLFRQSSNGKQAGTAYKIGPNGLSMNNGSSTKTPNTNSYAYGYETTTGITIEFGAQGSSMLMTVTLEGANPTPTLSPTSRPTPLPTPAPTRPPTQKQKRKRPQR
jgi:hypothetical protein